MATNHVDALEYRYGPPLGGNWEDLVTWDPDGEIYDSFFQGDTNSADPSKVVSGGESVTSDFPSAPGSVEDCTISEYPLSWASSDTSATTFDNSPLGFANDKVNTDSYDPFGLELQQAFSNCGRWIDQSPTAEPLSDIDFPRTTTTLHSDPRTSSASISSLSLYFSQPQIVEPVPAETESNHAIAIPQSIPRTSSCSVGSESSSSSLGWVQYQVNDSTRRLVPSGAGSNSGRRQRGRIRALTQDQRKNAALMRVVKACSNCRRRKERCDPGIPCRSCIEHYKSDLVYHPCREKLLADLTMVFLSERTGWHPTARTLDSFLGRSDYTISGMTYTVPLSLGFGPYIHRTVHHVRPADSSALYHQHIIYDWPPRNSAGSSRTHAVFPAILTSTTSLKQDIDAHLSLLVTLHFRAFPLYCSSLRVLRDIYVLYKSLPATSSQILLQALKLLVLVHIGGDITTCATDPAVASIMTSAGLPLTDSTGAPVSPTPCFIRAQFGAVMPALAQELMRDILARLERLALSRQCAQWPVILSTFAVLLMIVESTQYHAAKIAYHARYDSGPAVAEREQERKVGRELDEQGVDALLNFYKACYGGCHARLREDWLGEEEEGVNGMGKGSAAERFVTAMRTAIRNANEGGYLKERGLMKIESSKGGFSCFFDRLLARLFLLRN